MTDPADDATVAALEAALASHRATPLARRIERFYADNPGEWLTWADVADKFGCTEKQARDAVNHLRSRGRVDFEVVGVVRVKPAEA